MVKMRKKISKSRIISILEHVVRYNSEGHEIVIAFLHTLFYTFTGGPRNVENAAKQTGNACSKSSPESFYAPMHTIR